MTEEEAKGKWCPFARSPDNDKEGTWAANRRRLGAIDGGCKCIASACMAWRWDGRWDEGGTFLKRIGHGSYSGKIGETQGDGYCGLAGKPQ